METWAVPYVTYRKPGYSRKLVVTWFTYQLQIKGVIKKMEIGLKSKETNVVPKKDLQLSLFVVETK